MLDRRFPGPDTIFRHVLPNGITVLAYENLTSQTVAISGYICAGAVQEALHLTGLSSFTADMLLRGTEKYDFGQIYELLESHGAALDFGGGRHLTQFDAYCLVEDIDLVIDLLAQALRAPVFAEYQINRLRGQIATELNIRATDTERMASLVFMETLYSNHPYGRSIHGYIETIERIRRDDIAAFHKLQYGPNRMVIGIAGALPGEMVLGKMAEAFGDWENSKQSARPSVPDMPRPASEIVKVIPIAGKSQVDLVMGLPGPRRSAPDYLHCSLMNTILGVFGMMGRIGRNIREEQGLAYDASSHLAGGLGPAPWSAMAGTAAANVDGVIAGIKQEITRIQNEPVPSEELSDCKSYRIGSLPVSLETNAALADILVDMELYDLGLDYLQRFPGLIQNISAEQIQAAAQKYLSAEKLVIALAGPLPPAK